MTISPTGRAVRRSTSDPLASDRQAGRAREQLTTERDFICAVLDTVSALIVGLDREGRIVLFNQACVQVTGYTFEEVEGRHVWDMLLIPGEIEPVKSVFAELAAGSFPNKHVNYWVAKDGQRRLISWSNTALQGDDGTIEYVVGTGIDITEHATLERQLHRAQKLEAVGRLAGGLAHDLGSVLTAITGYADRVARHLEDDHAGHVDLQGVMKACERGTDLIRQLLVFSRRREVELVVLDLNAVVQDITTMLHRLIGDDVELHIDLARRRGARGRPGGNTPESPSSR